MRFLFIIFLMIFPSFSMAANYAFFQDLNAKEIEFYIPNVYFSVDSFKRGRVSFGPYISGHSIGTKFGIRVLKNKSIITGIGYRFFDSNPRSNRISYLLGLEISPRYNNDDDDSFFESRFFLGSYVDVKEENNLNTPRFLLGYDLLNKNIYKDIDRRIDLILAPYISTESLGGSASFRLKRKHINLRVFYGFGYRFYKDIDITSEFQHLVGLGVNL